jgi:hypothetical protein
LRALIRVRRGLAASRRWLPLAALALAAPALSAVREVGPGQTFTKIQAAIDASNAGDEIRVHPGTYPEALFVTARWLILSAADTTSPPLVEFTAPADSALLVFQGAAVDARTRISHFRFSGGAGWEDTLSGEHYGGAIAVLDSAAPVIAHCTLTGSTADWGGGLAARNAGAFRAERLLIADCEALRGGGGVYLDLMGSAALEFLTIDQNTAPAGGGLLVGGGSPSLRNSIVVQCTSDGVTITGGTLASDYNDVWGNTPANLVGGFPGPNDIVIDPRFVGGDPYDRHLTSRSPAIDAADPAAAVPLGGGDRADLGTFEFATGPTFVSAASTDPDVLYKNGDTVHFVVEWQADPPLTVTVDPDSLLAGLDSAPVTGAVTTLASSEPGHHRFALTATISAANTVADNDSIVVRTTAATNLGGRTTADALVVALDNTPPADPVLDPLVGSTTIPNVFVSGRVDRASGADSVVARVNGEDAAFGRPDAGGNFGLNVPLAERENQITVIALDRAGNASRETPSESVDFLPGLVVEVPKPFRPGDSFVVGNPVPPSAVEIRIVNLAGQLIRILNGGGQELIEVRWDGRNEVGQEVNGGPYLIRLRIEIPGQGTRVEDHAVLLVKGGAGS